MAPRGAEKQDEETTMMSNRRVGALDNRQSVDDEVTPERAARLRRLKR